MTQAKRQYVIAKRVLRDLAVDHDLSEDDADALEAALADAPIITIEPGQFGSYELFGHGECLPEPYDQEKAPPSFAVMVGRSLYFLDGQHRAASALADDKPLRVIALEADWLEPELKRRGHLRRMPI